MSERIKRLERLRNEIGAAITAARKARKLSQLQVAQQLGVEQETVSRIERGSTLVPLDRLLDISVLFDVPLASFFGAGTSPSVFSHPDVAPLFELLSPVQQQHVTNQTATLCRILLYGVDEST